jgi:hypothetical protein
MPTGNFAASDSITSIALPVLRPGAGMPRISAEATPL